MDTHTDKNETHLMTLLTSDTQTIGKRKTHAHEGEMEI